MTDLSEKLGGLSPHKIELLAQLLKGKIERQGQSRTINRRPDPRAQAPLSFGQERLLFLSQLEGEGVTYNAPLILRLTGPLDVSGLQYGLNEIVRRHEILRTSFVIADGQPVQIISEHNPIHLNLADLRSLNESDREAEAQRLIRENYLSKFDLGRGPLFRPLLLRLCDDEHILLLTMHHIVSDGWSSGVLLDELSKLYEAFLTGGPPPLSELTIQYADFSYWQRQQMQGALLDEQISFWKQRLEGGPTVLNLPTDLPRPAIQTFRGERQSIALSEDLSGRLKAFSQSKQASLFMTLFAAFNALLYRYTGQEDILVGTPSANRLWPEVQQLIGFFINTLILRTRLSGGAAFLEVLAQVREVALEAFAHQDLHFDKLVEVLQPERDLSRNPLIQVMFAFQEPGKPFKLPRAGAKFIDPPGGISRFDLSVDVKEIDGRLIVAIEYSTDLFYHSTVTRMLRHYENLLEGILANPEQRLCRLPLLSPDEERSMLVEWNDTARDYPANMCAHELFSIQAGRRPDTIALTFGEAGITYGELNRRANRLAHYLKSLGAGPESLVGIYGGRSVEMIVGVLATLKAGAAYVPLDPRYPAERLAFMLNDARPAVVLSQGGPGAMSFECDAQVIMLNEDWHEIEHQSDENPINESDPANLAYVIYTSGSTGEPKGVMLTHGGVANLITAQKDCFALSEADNILQFSSLCFDASVWEIVMALLTGATLCLTPDPALLDGGELIGLLHDKRISTLTLPPSILATLPTADLPDLRTVIAAGESCAEEIVKRWGPGRNFFNAYGPTETTVCASIDRCCEADDRKPTIGRPIANTRLYIVDNSYTPAPVGAAGELLVGGVGLARGYLKRPELTAEKFVPDCFGKEPGARLYRTGDLARYLPDGRVEFLGRIDHQVKIRGHRIEVGDIEAAIMQHPSALQCVVLVREKTAANKSLIAYIAADKKDAIDAAEMRQFLNKKLPSYMIPSAFVVLESFPLTPNGKVDYKLLRDSENFKAASTVNYAAPQNDIERVIADIWQEALEIEKVGIFDNFFELGAHSLLLLKARAKLQERLDRELPLVALFEYPTINALAGHISKAQETTEPLRRNQGRAARRKQALERQKLSRERTGRA
jgi:amino acid adenylation domain-containing protein